MPIFAKTTVLFIIWFLLILASVSVAQNTPTVINYQSLLTDIDDVPVTDSSYSVLFTIYDAAISGESKWTETRSVTTTGGLFSILLGSVNPLLDTVFDGQTRYLGIRIGTDPELTPRIAIVTVPYSMRVSTIDGAAGGNITGRLNVGDNNNISGDYAFIAGYNNTTNGNYSLVSGGTYNTASDDNATVAGGELNTASKYGATVGGGGNSTASGFYATVAGGVYNTASGYNAIVPGGRSNSADGRFSFATGRRAKAMHDGTFVWADTTDADFSSTGGNQFLVRASGGLGINSTDINLLPGTSLRAVSVNNTTYANLGTEQLGVHGVHIATGNEGKLGSNAEGAFGKHVSSGNYGKLGGPGFGAQGMNANGNIGQLGSDGSAVYGFAYVGPAGYFDGDLCYTGTLGTCSDARLKKNITPLHNALGLVLKLEGIRYDWRLEDFADRNFSEKRQLGFIAQEIEKLLPELVSDDGKGYLTIDYVKLTPVLVEAIKEQQIKIEMLESKLSELDALKELVNQLASKLNDNESTYGMK